MSHKINTLSIVAWCLLAATFATVANAGTYDQNLDSWSGGTALTNYYLNPDGWSVSNVAVTTIYTPVASSPKAAWLVSPLDSTNTAKPWIMSPLLTNGFGQIQWASRIQAVPGTNIYDVQWSTNAAAWTTLGTFTNSAAISWVTNQITTTNVYVPSYVRIRKISDFNVSNKRLGIDNINIALPVSYVTITNQAITPAQPVAGQPTEISAQILPFAFATNIQATVFYWTNIDASTTSSVNMAYLGTNTYTTTATNGILANIPGTVVSYYIRAVFDGPSSNGITQYWPSTWPSTPDQFMARIDTPASIYTNMILSGPPTTNLQLVTDNNWAGVTPKNSYTNPSLTFVSGTNTWGDTDESASFPLEGTAALNPNPISISGTITSRLYATFIETNLAYVIEPCNYVDFDSWGSAETYGAYTNNEGWQIVTGRTTTSAEQIAKAYQGTGRSLVLGNNNTNSYIRSPYLPNNMGLLVMRYRHYTENGSTPAALRVEKSFNITNGWLPVLEINPIYSPDYVYFAAAISDTSNHYFRIRNASTNNSEICIDEITITDPGALVALYNKQISPSSPLGSEPVAIQINYALTGGASNPRAKVYWKSPDSQNWTWQYLNDDGTNKFYGILPPTIAGTNEYYITCDYEGLHASTVYAPQGGSSAPDYYVVSTQYSGGTRIQNLDSWAGGTLLTNYYLNPDGWSISNVQVTTLYTPASPPKAAWLTTPIADTNPAKPWIMSPLLTNGFGQIQWASRIQAVPGTNIYDVQWSTNASSWTPLGTFTNDNSTSWVTNQIVNNYVHVPSYVRIRKIHDFNTSNRRLGIDNIIVTPPLADVVITNLLSSPGYPGTGDTVTVSCDIFTKDELYRAFDLRPKLAFKPAGGSWTTNNMSQVGSNTWAGTIGPQGPDIVEYFIRCDFAGFYYTNGAILAKNSPAFLPDAPATTNMPANPFQYIPRRFASEYSSVSASSSVGNVSMILVGSNNWQGVLQNVQSTQLLMNFSGIGYFNGSSYSSGTNFWGDNSQVLFDTPLSGIASLGASNIVINVDTSSMSQVLIRFNSDTGYYEVRRGAYEDFNKWRADPDSFVLSYNITDIILTTNYFNNWPTNAVATRPTGTGEGQANFEDPDWATNTSAFIPGPIDPVLVVPVNDRFWIQNFRIVSDVNANHAAEFNPAGGGALWPGKAFLMDGLGTLTWKAKCRFQDNYLTWYTNGLGWSNYYVRATVSATDPGVAYPRLSIFANYQNASNYFEAYLVQTNTTQVAYGIRSVINGSVSAPIAFGLVNTTLQTPHTLTLSVHPRSTAGAYLHLMMDASAIEGTTASTNLNAGGSIGFLCDDSDIVVDNIEVRPRNIRSFNNLTPESLFTTYTNDGWIYSDARRTGNECEINTNTNASVASPTLPFTPGELRFSCATPNPATNGAFIVEGFSGSTWTNIGSVYTNITWTSWTYGTISNGLSGYTRLRLRNATTNNVIRINDIWITASTNSYTNYFSGGAASTNGWLGPYGFWELDTVSQHYKRRGYCGPEIGFRIDVNTNVPPEPFQYPPIEATWQTNVFTYTISNHQYRSYSTNINFKYWGPMFPRIAQTTGAASLTIDDVTMSSWHAQNFESNDWQTTEGWIAKTAIAGNNQIELWRSRADPSKPQTLRTPKMTNGVGSIEFDYDFEGLNGANATFSIDYDLAPDSTNLTWTTLYTKTVNPTNLLPAHFYLELNDLSPIYVRVRHTTPTNTAIMKIDNFEITDYKEKDERTWVGFNAKITDLENGLEFEPLYSPADDVKTAYLNLNANSETLNGPFTNSVPYIQSGKVKEGIGLVSFWYRSWENDQTPPGEIKIFTSLDPEAAATNWTERATISNIINTDYRLYETNFYILEDVYLRVTSSTNSPSSRVCIDNMLVVQPLAADFTVQKIETIPTVPLYTDSVKIATEIGRFIMDPHAIDARLYYHIGTNYWGSYSNWNPANYIDMAVTSNSSTGIRFESIGNIPPQNIDTVVQYYVNFTFDGTFSSITSPKKDRTFTNPSWYSNINLNVGATTNKTPYYIVYSCPPDSAWINEFNYYYQFSGDANEFIEIAGIAGSRVENWTIQLVESDGNTSYGNYRILNALSNQYNGFGFWLLGDSGLSPDATFTNTAYSLGDLADIGGIRLIRSCGIWEDCVSYGIGGGSLTNFTYAGAKDEISDSSIALVGTGENAADFSWSYTDGSSLTPEAENEGQTLQLSSPPQPTYSITISNFWNTSSNTWIISVTDHSNQIAITPWYTTNLINTNWSQVPGVSQLTPVSGVYSQYFNNLTNTAPVYFRVTSTNDP